MFVEGDGIVGVLNVDGIVGFKCLVGEKDKFIYCGFDCGVFGG